MLVEDFAPLRGPHALHLIDMSRSTHEEHQLDVSDYHHQGYESIYRHTYSYDAATIPMLIPPRHETFRDPPEGQTEEDAMQSVQPDFSEDIDVDDTTAFFDFDSDDDDEHDMSHSKTKSTPDLHDYIRDTEGPLRTGAYGIPPVLPLSPSDRGFHDELEDDCDEAAMCLSGPSPSTSSSEAGDEIDFALYASDEVQSQDSPVLRPPTHAAIPSSSSLLHGPEEDAGAIRRGLAAHLAQLETTTLAIPAHCTLEEKRSTTDKTSPRDSCSRRC